MRLSEIKRYTSLNRGLTVHVEELDEVPGLIRTVRFHSDAFMFVEFYSSYAYAECDEPEEYLKIKAAYRSLEHLILDTEELTSSSLADWSNWSATKYNPRIIARPSQGELENYLLGIAREGLCFGRARAWTVLTPYYRHILKYGAYRKDKIEQEKLEWFQTVESWLL